jgi:hypothetical protein
MAFKNRRKTLRNIRENTNNGVGLPTHPHGFDAQIPDSFLMQGPNEGTGLKLPVHPHGHETEIPDSFLTMGSKVVRDIFDGQLIANRSGKYGGNQAVQIPEEADDKDLAKLKAMKETYDNDELDEEADDKDLAKLKAMKETYDNDELDEETDDEEMAKLRAMQEIHGDEDELDERTDYEKMAEQRIMEETYGDDDYELGEETDDKDLAKLKAMKEMADAEDDDKEISEEEEKELEEQRRAEAELDAALDEEDDADLKKHIEALTSDSDLPESFKRNAATIFEAAVRTASKKRITVARNRIEKAAAQKLSRRSSRISEALTTKVDGYLDYVVEEWITENEVAIESGLKSQIVEKFIHGLKGLFEAHYIEVPANKTNILAEQARKIAGLESELNQSLNRNVNQRKKLTSLEKRSVVQNLCGGLTVSEAVKFSQLCEGVSFENAEAYKEKLSIVKETYFPKTSKRIGSLDNALLTEGGIRQSEKDSPNSEVDSIVDAISRMVKK